MVAFANTDGGTIVIGVDERAGFALVDLPDVGRYRDRLVDLSRSAVTPPLQINTEFVELEGRRVLMATVATAAADQRPVYVTSKGVSGGAYLRTGDGAVRQGGRRYTRYVLDPAAVEQPTASRARPAVDLESALREAGTASAAELQSWTGLSRATVTDKLRELGADGLVRAHGAQQSPKRTYEWTGKDADPT